MPKFFRPGKSVLKALPAVAGASPTRPEITAGRDISLEVASISGFGIANAPIETPNLGEAFVSQIDGPDKVTGDSALTLYDEDPSTATRTQLAKGATQFMVFFPYGDVAGKRCEKWKVKITGNNDETWSTSGSDPARYVVSCAVLETPNQDAVVPA